MQWTTTNETLRFVTGAKNNACLAIPVGRTASHQRTNRVVNQCHDFHFETLEIFSEQFKQENILARLPVVD